MSVLTRTLIRLHPASFRDRFGDEILQVIEDMRRDGVGGRQMDLLRSALVQRWEDGHVNRHKIAAAAFLVLAVGGGTVMVIGARANGRALGIATMIFLFIALTYGLAAVLAKVGRHGAERDYSTRRFRWWWVLAGGAAVLELMTVVHQITEDPKPENLVALAFGLLFAGLIAGGMAVRNRKAGNWMLAAGVLPLVPFIWFPPAPVAAMIVIVAALSENIRLGARTIEA